MVCKHYVQVPLLVYLLAVVEVELPNQFLVVAEAINPIPFAFMRNVFTTTLPSGEVVACFMHIFLLSLAYVRKK